MGQTNFGEGLVRRNEVSMSISAAIKKNGASLLTPLHIYGEENSMPDIPSRSFGSNISWFCTTDNDLLNFSIFFPFSRPRLLHRLQPFKRSEYESYFSAADAVFRNGRVASTQKVRKTCLKNWCSFVRPLGVEPWLQDDMYQQRVW